MSVPGARARVTDVPGGIALELSTDASPDDVKELRRRARLMADQGQLGVMAGPGGGIGAAGQVRNFDVAVRTSSDASRTEDTPNGVRIVVVATDPNRVDTLRARAHAHAQHMAASPSCGQRKR